MNFYIIEAKEKDSTDVLRYVLTTKIPLHFPSKTLFAKNFAKCLPDVIFLSVPQHFKKFVSSPNLLMGKLRVRRLSDSSKGDMADTGQNYQDYDYA